MESVRQRLVLSQKEILWTNEGAFRTRVRGDTFTISQAIPGRPVGLVRLHMLGRLVHDELGTSLHVRVRTHALDALLLACFWLIGLGILVLSVLGAIDWQGYKPIASIVFSIVFTVFLVMYRYMVDGPKLLRFLDTVVPFEDD